jgi:kynurenine formamidase
MSDKKKSAADPITAGEIRPFGRLPSPRLTPDLLKLVRTGEVYSLEQILEPGIPFWEGHPPLVLSPYVRHGDMPELEPASVGNEITTIPMHGCTHIDALSHIGKWQGDEIFFHGGVKVREVMNNNGYSVHGADNFPPIILRGVLLDVAAHKGLEVLPDSYGITGQDLDDCAQAQKVEITQGSAVIIRTGFAKYWRTDNPRFSNQGAGPNIDGARYLAEKKIALVGSDTEAVEQWPFDPDGPPLPVHTFLLVDNGITHVESLYLERLAADKVYEFLFIALPLRIRGATGSQIHPIAIA